MLESFFSKSKPATQVKAPRQSVGFTESALVDAYVKAEQAFKEAEAKKEVARRELLTYFALNGCDSIKGFEQQVRLTTSIRSTLDLAVVRAEMGEAWTAAHSKQSQVRQLSILPLV